MSGIYIPGMEMSINCEKCPFLDYEEGFCLASAVKGKSGWYESVLRPGSIKDGRHDDCPLIPVPEHGRLKDYDAIYSEYKTWFDNAECRDYESMFYALWNAFSCARTIIPADKEKQT